MSVSGGGVIYAADINRALAGGPERPLCILRNTAVISVANNSIVTPLTWDIEVKDTHGWHSTSANTSRITPLKAGWVQVHAVIHWAGNATGRRATVVKKSAGTANYGEIKAATSSSGVSTVLFREIEVDGVTDYLEIFGFQESGAALNTADVVNTFFSVTWLRES